MKKMIAAVLTLLPALRAAAAPESAAGNREIAEARRALAAAGAAYRSVPALDDVMTYTVKAPNADLEPKQLRVRIGPGRDVFVGDPLLSATAVGTRLYLTKSDAPGRYVEKPYDGDFAKSLDSIVGTEGSLFEPAEVALRLGKGIDQVIDALRFKLLAPLRIVRFGRVRDEGREYDEIRFAADNGSEEIRLDAATHFFAFVHARIVPPGAPAGVSVDIRAKFSPAIVSVEKGAIRFATEGLLSVPSLSDLVSASLPTGIPAPDCRFENLRGDSISLSSLRGRVVVLDFWATWCVPCWTTLHDTERLAEWGAAQTAPPVVYAVNTLEKFTDRNEARAKISEFLRAQKLTLTPMIDQSSFSALGSPGLPSLVVIGRSGKIFKYYQGRRADMLDSLEKAVADAAGK